MVVECKTVDEWNFIINKYNNYKKIHEKNWSTYGIKSHLEITIISFDEWCNLTNNKLNKIVEPEDYNYLVEFLNKLNIL